MTIKEITYAMSQGSRFGHLGTEDKLTALEGVIMYLYALRGLSVEGTETQGEIKVSAGILEDRVSHRFPHLTIAEIKLALELGVTGYWGKETRCTIANYISWLEKYNSCPERQDALQARDRSARILTAAQASRLLTPELETDLNEEAAKRSALKEYANFKANHRLDILSYGYGAMIYDYLVKRGCMNPNERAIREAYRRSRAHATRKGITRIGESIRNVVPETATAGQLLDYPTKCELLTIYYDTIIRQGKELQL